MKKDFLYADDGGAIGDGYSSDSSMDPNFVNEGIYDYLLYIVYLYVCCYI